MSCYDSRSGDPTSYSDRRSDSGLGAPTGFGGSVQHSSSSRRDGDDVGSPRKLDLDGLPHFEKNFFTESPAVRAMTEAEVNEYRQQREITVEGQDVPKPVKTFQDAGFPEYVIQEITKAGFAEPTPIQSQGWPRALKGRDLIGIAETGSGKTLAYLLPAIVHVNAQPILVGRTGRAGAKGTAYTFFTAANARFAKELITILEEAGQKVSPELAAMGHGAPPVPSGPLGFHDCGRGYGSARPLS